MLFIILFNDSQLRMQTRMQTTKYNSISSVMARIKSLFVELDKTCMSGERIQIIIRTYRALNELHKNVLHKNYDLFELFCSNQESRRNFLSSIIDAAGRLTLQIKVKMSKKKEIDEEYTKMTKCIHLMHSVKKKYEFLC